MRTLYENSYWFLGGSLPCRYWLSDNKPVLPSFRVVWKIQNQGTPRIASPDYTQAHTCLRNKRDVLDELAADGMRNDELLDL
jgi:hypothetical protein